jgi:hypothetical protein
MNAADTNSTVDLLATQFQKAGYRKIIMSAVSSPIRNTVGVKHGHETCQGLICGGTAGENEVHGPTKPNGATDASDPSKLKNIISVDLGAAAELHTDPNAVEKHELTHTGQLNSGDTQKVLDTEHELGQNSPYETEAKRAEAQPDEPNTLSYGRAVTDVQILLGLPHDYIPFADELAGDCRLNPGSCAPLEPAPEETGSPNKN